MSAPSGVEVTEAVPPVVVSGADCGDVNALLVDDGATGCSAAFRTAGLTSDDRLIVPDDSNFLGFVSVGCWPALTVGAFDDFSSCATVVGTTGAAVDRRILR